MKKLPLITSTAFLLATVFKILQLAIAYRPSFKAGLIPASNPIISMIASLSRALESLFGYQQLIIGARYTEPLISLSVLIGVAAGVMLVYGVVRKQLKLHRLLIPTLFLVAFVYVIFFILP